MDFLNELQIDALTEAFNIGMGSAAASLSEMVNEEITLSIPQLSFLQRSEAVKILSDKAAERLSGVTQEFEGAFNGEAMLLFPVSKSLELVRLMLRDSVPLEQLTDFEQEALNEIGNIILNAGLSSMADMLGEEMKSSLPLFRQGSSQELLAAPGENPNEVVLFLRVDFGLQTHAIDGYLVFLLEITSIETLADHVNRYLEKLGF